MNKLNQVKTKIKGWVKDYKGAIITTSIAIVSSVLIVTLMGMTKRDVEMEHEIEAPPQFDRGKELEMQFVDPETGDILGWGTCHENYMIDIIKVMSDY